MRKITVFFALAVLILTMGAFVPPSSEEANFRIASYNIRYAAKQDEQTGNGWERRRQPLASLMQRHGFDIVGTQEGNNLQLKDLAKLMPEFDVVAHPYGGKGDLHNCAILYKRATFELLDSGVFWLSETPEMPSIGWDASDRRICQWAKFKEKKSGKEFFMFNAHFYWRKEIARREAGPLLANQINAIAGQTPVLLTGDFNSIPATPQINALKKNLKDCYDATETERQGIEETGFSGGVFQGQPKIRIDYIFVSPEIRVHDYHVISDMYNGDRYPSDHLPVTSLVTF